MDPTYFCGQWTMATPSDPTVKFHRLTPNLFEAWVPIIINPDNNKLQDNKDKVWDEFAIAELKKELYDQYLKSNTERHSLKVLVEVGDNVVGFGDIFIVEKNVASIGVVLNEEARGKGLGKLVTCVLAQLALASGLQVVAGTMKDNKPMRAILNNLGFEEKEEILELEGRGVVAEYTYSLPRDGWKEVPLRVLL